MADLPENQMPDGGGAGALGLLSGPFGGSFPSIQGGHAGPSSASLDNQSEVFFNSSFSVAGQGGRSNASATPTLKDGGFNDPLIMAAGLIAMVLILRKK